MEKFMSSSSSSSGCKNQLHVDRASKLQFCHLPDNIFFYDRYFFFTSFCFTVNFSLRIFVFIPTLETAVSEDDGSLKIVP